MLSWSLQRSPLHQWIYSYESCVDRNETFSFGKDETKSKYQKQIVIFQSEPEDLLNHFPAYVLPSNYGGSLNDYHNGDLLRKLNREHGNFPIGGRPNYF
ncbi:hypothetical protein AVEN_140500-1 [Araneus ventricosus]|uniref:CRAL-TRIO domain-containing protein n=1 Tax=Araneus ventricosus TaxID=182803 RepID=A0A4Y2FS43_ARAVE|nr:hypothetical protein AVEN_245151-1 [Araneus ventricosus]GBM44386.1 hypothetical protein AVEN_140500-1 [Araneus ventricosus]